MADYTVNINSFYTIKKNGLPDKNRLCVIWPETDEKDGFTLIRLDRAYLAYYDYDEEKWRYFSNDEIVEMPVTKYAPTPVELEITKYTSL